MARPAPYRHARMLLRIASFVAIAAVSGAAHAQDDVVGEYVFGVGDAVSLTVYGLPELETAAVVDADGKARFPRFGALNAAGRTAAEIERDLRERADGTVYKRYDADFQPVFVTLSPEDISVGVSAYRPIYVTGDVGRPGALDYLPGLTARAAIAAAGGLALGGLDGDDLSPREEARLRGQEQRLRLEISNLRADLWRLEAALAKSPSPPAPDPESAPISPALFEQVVDVGRDRLQFDLEQLERERVFLETAREQAAERLQLLVRQAENQRTAVEFDDEEVERVSGLFDRGIVPIDRLVNIRRAQLDSSTRLLQTEDGIERITLELTRFGRQLEALDEDWRIGLTAELDSTRRRLRDSMVSLAATRAQLGSIAAELANLEDSSRNPTLTLHRDTGGAVVSAVIVPDERLGPGDVLEVTLPLLDVLLTE